LAAAGITGQPLANDFSRRVNLWLLREVRDGPNGFAIGCSYATWATVFGSWWSLVTHQLPLFSQRPTPLLTLRHGARNSRSTSSTVLITATSTPRLLYLLWRHIWCGETLLPLGFLTSAKTTRPPGRTITLSK